MLRPRSRLPALKKRHKAASDLLLAAYTDRAPTYLHANAGFLRRFSFAGRLLGNCVTTDHVLVCVTSVPERNCSAHAGKQRTSRTAALKRPHACSKRSGATAVGVLIFFLFVVLPSTRPLPTPQAGVDTAVHRTCAAKRASP